ncbi:MAG: 30S ribosomal protein S5 [Deltaproteobacteria bacterium]
MVLNVNRVSRVVKGGRRFRFKALVAVGDGKTKIGVGVAKGADVQAAVAKATNVAKKQMVTIAVEKGTIAHEAEVKFTGAHVLLKPASPGTGVIAGGAARAIFEAAGINNILSKCLGSNNPHNVIKAAFAGLKRLKTPEEIAARRGIVE